MSADGTVQWSRATEYIPPRFFFSFDNARAPQRGQPIHARAWDESPVARANKLELRAHSRFGLMALQWFPGPFCRRGC